ncbi:MAG: secreted protein, partial [Humibacillus sp.]|nr:secreted protein [Humibacillus sp.]
MALAAVPTAAFAAGSPTSAPATAASVTAAAAPASTTPDLGAHTLVFDPSMPQSEIQAKVDAVAKEQVPNEMGSARYALLFKPGTYGTAAAPLSFQVGYYTEVAGLGQNPGDVVVNGTIYVHNQCYGGNCIALNNFWRSMSNLTINVTNKADAGCYANEFWAVSQAAPLRRVDVKGATTLMDYCTGPSFASGGFIADSRFSQQVINGSQQQFFVRNSTLNGWTNGVWNQVFSGTVGAPAECFPPACTGSGPYTTVDRTSVSREKPYLYVDPSGAYRVFVPAAATDSRGVSWAAGSTPGRSVPISDFYVAKPTDSAQAMNSALAQGKNLLLTPGVYHLDQTVKVKRAGTIVLGLGLSSLTPTSGQIAMSVADVPGVDIAGITFDAGPVNSPVLLQIGSGKGAKGQGYDQAGKSSATDPTGIQDVFFRIGGPSLGKATVSLEVNADHVVLDDIWAWRADHGNGVGWTKNTADTGVVVNGDHVTATGLFVEHYQKTEVIWNGNDGQVTFFQNELPYDPPSQAAWQSAPGHDGYPALLVTDGVTSFRGTGMGSYSFFNQGVDIFAENAYEVPRTPGVRLHDLLTIFLDPANGKGGIRHVVNGVGGSSTIANPDVPVT